MGMTAGNDGRPAMMGGNDGREPRKGTTEGNDVRKRREGTTGVMTAGYRVADRALKLTLQTFILKKGA